jgi:hypothetical protein
MTSLLSSAAADPVSTETHRARVLAFFLPQYHPIPENDEWWGPGFTEWTNVAAARPLYRGHMQPKLPGALGFYDLRVPETRAAQAQLASSAGVEAFCYWHYWFGGRRILDDVFAAVLGSGDPSLPFALGWANQSWTGIWHGAEDRVLIEQTYPGDDDHRRHFDVLAEAFGDERYFRVDGRPLFYIYDPRAIPRIADVAALWRRLAERAGLGGLYLVGEAKGFHRVEDGLAAKMGLDAIVPVRLPPHARDPRDWLRNRRLGARLISLRGPTVYDGDRLVESLAAPESGRLDVHPCVIPNWDNTPRSGRRGRVIEGISPRFLGRQLSTALDAIEAKPFQSRLLFVKSWNEWAEGNYLEPDRSNGSALLDVLRQTIRLA